MFGPGGDEHDAGGVRGVGDLVKIDDRLVVGGAQRRGAGDVDAEAEVHDVEALAHRSSGARRRARRGSSAPRGRGREMLMISAAGSHAVDDPGARGSMAARGRRVGRDDGEALAAPVDLQVSGCARSRATGASLSTPESMMAMRGARAIGPLAGASGDRHAAPSLATPPRPARVAVDPPSIVGGRARPRAHRDRRRGRRRARARAGPR